MVLINKLRPKCLIATYKPYRLVSPKSTNHFIQNIKWKMNQNEWNNFLAKRDMNHSRTKFKLIASNFSWKYSLQWLQEFSPHLTYAAPKKPPSNHHHQENFIRLTTQPGHRSRGIYSSANQLFQLFLTTVLTKLKQPKDWQKSVMIKSIYSKYLPV